MNLVFFDIECASVHKTYAKICAFGFVACDENFNIIEKEDILINPRGRFELTDRKGEKGITLPYEYEEFKKHPPYPSVHNRVKKLLEDENTLVFGHAVLNDVKYLNLETRRFRLPSFNFRFYDSQLMFMSLKGDFTRQYGLEHIAEQLGVEFTPHRAADDAYATMRIVEAMCKSQNCTLTELLQKLCVTAGRISNYSVVRPQSGAFKKFNKEKREKKEARSKARIKFNNHFSRKRPKKEGRLRGITITFSRAIEDDLNLSLPLVDEIYEKGGQYTQQMENCNCFVQTEGDETARARTAKSSEAITVITLNGLKELLNG